MLRLVSASILAAAFACLPMPEVGHGDHTPDRSSSSPVVSTQKVVRIVPARDGGVTCLTADDVRRLQAYLDRCPQSAP